MIEVRLMKTFKVSIVMVAFLLVVTAMQPVAHAMVTSMPHGGSYTGCLESFNSCLCDMGPSDAANTGIDIFSLSSAPVIPVMESVPDRPARHSFDAQATIIFSNSEIARIFLRMIPNYCSLEIGADDITFPNSDLTHSITIGRDLFQSLHTHFVDGQPTSITISSTEDLDGSNTPVPASALLLFTGLIGLIGFRRRMMNR